MIHGPLRHLPHAFAFLNLFVFSLSLFLSRSVSLSRSLWWWRFLLSDTGRNYIIIFKEELEAKMEASLLGQLTPVCAIIVLCKTGQIQGPCCLNPISQRLSLIYGTFHFFSLAPNGCSEKLFIINLMPAAGRKQTEDAVERARWETGWVSCSNH